MTDLPNAHAHNQPQVFKIFNSISRLLIDRLDLWKNRLDSIDLSMIFRSTRLGRFSIDSIDQLRGLLHGSQVVGISRTCLVEQRAQPMFSRATITWALAHILVLLILCNLYCLVKMSLRFLVFCCCLFSLVLQCDSGFPVVDASVII